MLGIRVCECMYVSVYVGVFLPQARGLDVCIVKTANPQLYAMLRQKPKLKVGKFSALQVALHPLPSGYQHQAAGRNQDLGVPCQRLASTVFMALNML